VVPRRAAELDVEWNLLSAQWEVRCPGAMLPLARTRYRGEAVSLARRVALVIGGAEVHIGDKHGRSVSVTLIGTSIQFIGSFTVEVLTTGKGSSRRPSRSTHRVRTAC